MRKGSDKSWCFMRQRGLDRFFLLAILFLLVQLVLHENVLKSSLNVHANQYQEKRVDDAVIGWDGDKDAVIAHEDGSFDVRAGKNLAIRFGIYHSPISLTWNNVNGYLPALITQFERNNSTISITHFGDKVTIQKHDFVIIYSRVAISNHDIVSHNFDPAPTPGLTTLVGSSNDVDVGKIAIHDYAIAVDKFGNTYDWPDDQALIQAGNWEQHFLHMQKYWNDRLASIVQIKQLPDQKLIDAFKAGYIYTHIVKDGNLLYTGENGYDALYDHDLVDILVNLFNQGDFKDAHAFLESFSVDQYLDAAFKFSWPWAIYLFKTGDTDFVRAHFSEIQKQTHRIESNRTGPNRVIGSTHAIDGEGMWTVDDESALLGLLSYGYIAQRLGNRAENQWAHNQYRDLLASVNKELTTTIQHYHLSYLPCAVNMPNTMNFCQTANDANWAATFLFGHWSWDGYLFNGEQSGPLLDMIDKTYDYGFQRLKGLLPEHTYGGYPGYSSAYNAGYGAAGLRGEHYRGEAILDYEFMLSKTMNGPFSWWEDIKTVGSSDWVGTHAQSGRGSSPHMWGQALASKVLLDALISEKIDGQLIIGRGIPEQWAQDGKTIELTNYPLSSKQRIGMQIATTGNTVKLTLSGAIPAGQIDFELPGFRNNIYEASTGTVNNADGVVEFPASERSVTVELMHL